MRIAIAATINVQEAMPLLPLARMSAVSAVAVGVLLTLSRSLIAQDITPEAARQIQALMEEKAARTSTQQKISSQLLYAAKQQRGEPLAAGVRSLRLSARADTQQRMLVDIRATVSPALLQRIATLGGTVLSSFPPYDAIRARLPVDAIETLAAENAVRTIRPAALRVRHKLTTSEGDIAHRANQARATFGIDGSGVKIGVISDSVDHLATVQSSGDLGPVTVLTGQSGIPGSGEGTALLEIISDLAPGAELFFATSGDTDAAMATNIQALRSAGCDILVDDIGFLDEPVFQDGILAAAVNAVTASGGLFFSAVGNEGNLDHHTSGVWEGDFSASENMLGGEVLHSFGTTTSNIITGDAPFAVTLQWSDPFGASANDYDLFLLNAAGTRVEAASTDLQNGSGDPIEAIDTSQFGVQGERLAIGKAAGDVRFLHLNTHGGRLEVATSGQAFGHPAAADAFAVAAVAATDHPFTGGAANPVEDFSADGPRRVFYEADGTPITPGNFTSTGGTVRRKPDVTAADGVQVSTPGFSPFFGTSAAAPHAAAIAALVKSANPTLTAAQVRAALIASALDIEAPGFDRDSGAGILDAFGAVQLGGVVRSPTPSAAPTPSQTPTPPVVCAGDCDGGATVTVDEIIVLVDITLGSALADACPHGVPGGTTVDITLIVRAVNNALGSCPR